MLMSWRLCCLSSFLCFSCHTFMSLVEMDRFVQSVEKLQPQNMYFDTHSHPLCLGCDLRGVKYIFDMNLKSLNKRASKHTAGATLTK